MLLHSFTKSAEESANALLEMIERTADDFMPRKRKTLKKHTNFMIVNWQS